MQIYEKVVSDSAQLQHQTNTDLGVELEPAVWRKNHDRRWAKRVFRRQQDAEVIESPLKIGPRGTTQSAMPFLRQYHVSV